MLLALMLAIVIGVQRLAIDGPARFDPTAIHGGWLASLLALGTCWIVVRGRDASSASPGASSVATLFSLLLSQQLLLSALLGLVYVAAVFWVPVSVPYDIDALLDQVWLAALLWFALAALVLLRREAPRRLGVHAAIVVYGVLSIVLQMVTPEARFWTAPADASADAVGERGLPADPDGPAPLALSQQTIEAQARTLPAALGALAPGRPGVVDLYAITFAPYADEDVFSREATLVSELMRSSAWCNCRTTRSAWVSGRGPRR